MHTGTGLHVLKKKISKRGKKRKQLDCVNLILVYTLNDARSILRLRYTVVIY